MDRVRIYKYEFKIGMYLVRDKRLLMENILNLKFVDHSSIHEKDLLSEFKLLFLLSDSKRVCCLQNNQEKSIQKSTFWDLHFKLASGVEDTIEKT